MQVHQEALADKRMSKKDKFQWVKLAEDKYFNYDERKRPLQPIQVNVGQMQNFITGSMGKGLPVPDEDGVIDINEADESIK